MLSYVVLFIFESHNLFGIKRHRHQGLAGNVILQTGDGVLIRLSLFSRKKSHSTLERTKWNAPLSGDPYMETAISTPSLTASSACLTPLASPMQ